MAVVIETTLGDITVDLYLDQRPVTCLNFLKLCKMKYYNFNLFHSIRSGFIAQTGDPTGEGTGGESIWGILEGPQKRFFSGEKLPKIRHTDAGLISMVCTDDMMVGSQFFFTLAPDLDSLDGTHCVIGEVTEGREVLSKLNEVICDEGHRPYRDVRITHTVVLEDPFSDPPGLRAPSRSPSPNPERLKGGRIAPDEEIDETQGKSAVEIQELIEEKEAKARATILEIVGDLPDADIAPPENVLFVCKLNPVTTDDDLEIIFSRFGKIVSCEVIRDKSSGNSLQYAFIEFENKKSCEDAYFKMDNVLIDDRRIHVDFSQSVSKMRWLGKGRGVQYFDKNAKELNSKKPDKEQNREKDGESGFKEPHRKREHHRHYNREKDYDRDREVRHHKDRSHKEDRDRNCKKAKDREKSKKEDKIKQNKEKSNRDQNRDRSRSRHRSKEKVRNGEDRERSSQKSDGSHYRNNHTSNDKHSRTTTNKSRSSPDRKDKESSSRKLSYKEKEYNKKSKKENSLKNPKLENDDKKNTDTTTHSRKKTHSHKKDEKTPSPLTDSKTKKTHKLQERSNKSVEKPAKKQSSKRKRKASTSSSDSSSESSSSSSESSSSSGSNHKKRVKNKKRRKCSTSSSSSSSSNTSDSTSSSSSSSSSSTSSSSSDSEPKRKSKKTVDKKNKKIRKK